MPSLPSSLALTSIPDGALITAADHRNNYAAIQTEANALITLLAGGTAGQVLGGVGTTLTYALPPGYTYSYTQKTTDTTTVATTEATATTVVIDSSRAYDGTPIWLEFFSEAVTTGTTSITLLFFDGTVATPLGQLGIAVAGTKYSVTHKLRVAAPSVGSHAYGVAAFVDAGTGTVIARTGGAGTVVPCFLRITKE